MSFKDNEMTNEELDAIRELERLPTGPLPSSMLKQLKRDPADLTPQQARFCRAYVITKDFNRAALAAGYGRMTLQKKGKWLLDRKPIQEYIAQLEKEMQAEQDMVVQRLLGEIQQVAFADAYQLAEKGCRGGEKLKAMTLLAKIWGLVSDDKKVEQSTEQQQVVVLNVPGREADTKDG